MAGFIIERKPIEIDMPMRPLYAMKAGDLFIAGNASGNYLMRITGFTLKSDHRLLSGVVASTRCRHGEEVSFCFRGPAIKGSIEGFQILPLQSPPACDGDFSGLPLKVTYTGHIHNQVIPCGSPDDDLGDFRAFLEGRRSDCDQATLDAMIKGKLAARESVNGCILDMLREICSNPTMSPNADITKMNYWAGHTAWGYGEFARAVMAEDIDGLDYELADMLSNLSGSITTGQRDNVNFQKAILMVQVVDFDGLAHTGRASGGEFSPGG